MTHPWEALQAQLSSFLSAIDPSDWASWGVCFASFGMGLFVSYWWHRRPAHSMDTHGQPVIPSYREALSAFTRELERVRRFDRPLAVAVLKLEDVRSPESAIEIVPSGSSNGNSNGNTSGNGEAALSNSSGATNASTNVRANSPFPVDDHEAILRATRHIMFWNIGYALRDLLRESDVAACDISNQRYIILLPESGEENALLAASRIEERILESIGVRVRKGIAVFRSEGLTIADLVESASAKCDRSPASRPVVRSARTRIPRFPRLVDPRT